MELLQDELMKQTFQILMNHSTDIIFIKDRNLVYVAASMSFARLLGLSSESEIIGKQDKDIFGSTLAKQYVKDDQIIFETGATIEHEKERIPDIEGNRRYSTISKFPLYNEHRDIIAICGIARDITIEIELETEKESTKLSKGLFDIVLEGDITRDKLIDIQGKEHMEDIEKQNVAFSYTMQEMGREYVFPDHVKAFLTLFQVGSLQQQYGDGIQEQDTLFLVRKNQKYHWMEFKMRIYQSKVSNSLRITIFIKDRDLEIRHQNHLQQKAVTDALTGLQNRESILHDIEEFLKENKKGVEHALLFIDLDQFKQVNDQWGHRYGDEILRQTSRLLKHAFIDGELIGRIGGDEFVIFLKQIPARDYALKKAKEVVELLSTSFIKDDICIDVSASVGIAIAKDDSVSVEQLYEQSDKAMYYAKTSSGRQICFYDEVS